MKETFQLTSGEVVYYHMPASLLDPRPVVFVHGLARGGRNALNDACGNGQVPQLDLTSHVAPSVAHSLADCLGNGPDEQIVSFLKVPDGEDD